MTLGNRDQRKYAYLLGVEIKNSYKHYWMKMVECFYIMHNYVVGLEADTRATTDKFSMACLWQGLFYRKSTAMFRSKLRLACAKPHESRDTRDSTFSKTENIDFKIEVVGATPSHRIESLENVLAVKNFFFFS